MTPIRQQFDTNMFAINALQNIVKQNAGMNNNIFSANGSVFTSELQLLGLIAQCQTFNFSSMPSMPAFNFDFTSMKMPAFNFNFNFGSLLGGGALRHSNVKLTSNKAQNAVQIALSQVGVKEVGESNNGADVNKYRNGVQNGTAWCASFVSWCYGKGQNSNNKATFGYDVSSQSIRRKAEKAGYYKKVSSGYTPKVGDVVVWNNGNGTGHVGIISNVNPDGSFKTVEGNCSNAVREMTRQRSEVDGFVQMNEWLASNDNGSKTSNLA